MVQRIKFSIFVIFSVILATASLQSSFDPRYNERKEASSHLSEPQNILGKRSFEESEDPYPCSPLASAAHNSGSDLRISVLSEYSEHVEALNKALSSAQKNILITNWWGIQGNQKEIIFSQEPLYKFIPAAVRKNVNVSLSFGFKPDGDLPEKLERYLKKHKKIRSYDVENHAKIVLVDRRWLMIGSFEWLVNLAYPDNENLDRSIVIESPRNQIPWALTRPIYDSLQTYTHSDYLPSYKRQEILEKAQDLLNNPHVTIPFQGNSSLTLSAAVTGHRQLLLDAFKQATKRITILSPFVNKAPKRNYGQDITKDLLRDAAKRNIYVTFVVGDKETPGQWGLNEWPEDFLKGYLNELFGNEENWPAGLKVIAAPIHAKTITVDDTMLIEGSYNWLQSARSTEDSHNKNEAVVAIRGNQAKQLIRDFYESELGHEIFESNSSAFPAVQESYEPALTEDESDDALALDSWMSYPFWKRKSRGIQMTLDGENYKIMSGAGFGHPGKFCGAVSSLNNNKRNEYIKYEDGTIAYYSSIDDVKEALFYAFEPHLN